MGVLILLRTTIILIGISVKFMLLIPIYDRIQIGAIFNAALVLRQLLLHYRIFIPMSRLVLAVGRKKLVASQRVKESILKFSTSQSYYKTTNLIKMHYP